MSKKTRLKIGEFSQLMQVSVKTLRYYEQRGLLAPDEVDEWTGYRYYCIDQMQQLNDIRDLQRLGFSLDEIKDMFDNGSHTPTIRQMTEKIRETEAQLKALIFSLIWRMVGVCEPSSNRSLISSNEKPSPCSSRISFNCCIWLML